MNKLKQFAPLLLAVVLFSSCKKEEEADDSTTTPPVTSIQSDHGKMKLVYGSTTMDLEGACTIGNISGHPTITVQDATDAGRTFTISLMDNLVPIVSGTYPFSTGVGQPAAGTVGAMFVDDNVGYWSSDQASGSVVFTVTGTEGVCTMTNVPFQPHPNINTGATAVTGNVSGTFKFDVQ